MSNSQILAQSEWRLIFGAALFGVAYLALCLGSELAWSQAEPRRPVEK